MSVKERLAELQRQEAQQEAAEKEAKRTVEEKRSLAYWEKYYSEDESVRKIHANLLEELRSLDIVQIIEEAVDHPILPLRAVRDGKYAEYIVRQPTQEEIDKKHKAAMKSAAPQWPPYKEWQAVVLLPDISRKTLVGDKSLKIHIFREHFQGSLPFITHTDGVIAEFSPDKQLKISGEKQTYSGPIPVDLAIIEQTIAEALLKPAVRSSR